MYNIRQDSLNKKKNVLRDKNIQHQLPLFEKVTDPLLFIPVNQLKLILRLNKARHTHARLLQTLLCLNIM